MPVCPQCDNRPFANKEALLQHIRSSSAWHPFCGVCDRRFTSTTAFNAHMTAKHPPTWDCALCVRSYHAEFALDDHYRGSTAHPNCSACGQGFFDVVARDEHHRVAHAPGQSATLSSSPHGDGLQLSPEETKSICDLVDSDSVPIPTTPPQDHSVDPVISTGFTPLTPHNLAQRLILGESARERETFHSPDIYLETASFASPLLETKPIFSPMTTYLPRPGTGFDEIWRSKENVSNRPTLSTALITTSNPPLRPPLTSSFTRHSTFQNSSALPPLPRLSDPSALRNPSTVGLSSFSSRFSTVPRTGRDSSFVNSSRDSFDRRLYPGSLRQRARLAITEPLSTNSAPASQGEFEVGSISSHGTYSNFAHGRPRGASTDSAVSWASLMDSDPLDTGDIGRLPTGSPPPTARISAHNSGTSTPRLSGSISDNDEYASSLLDLDTPTVTSAPVIRDGSPTAASASSPGSSASYFYTSSPKTHEADTRPTTANSSHGSMNLKYIITASSERGGSPLGSPTVDSPVDLGVLPGISPLITTPIDTSFEIAEARRPLPESPLEPSSPITVIVDEPSEGALKALPHPELLPLEPPQATISPISDSHSPHPLKIEPTSIASPKSPVPHSANPNPLHCRACLADSCDDITASMCGHIFCNRCITDAVIKTSRCPVCMTPTLLYCLFRLDLGA